MIPRGKEEGSRPPGRSRWEMLAPLRSTLFQWFFIALSVRPLRYFAISDHRFPKCLCSSSNMRSSATVHGSFLTLSSKWLCHLSRHCLPVLPLSWAATAGHARVPSSATICLTIASSAFVHGLLCTRFFSMELRRWRCRVSVKASSSVSSSSEQLDPESRGQRSSEQSEEGIGCSLQPPRPPRYREYLRSVPPDRSPLVHSTLIGAQSSALMIIILSGLHHHPIEIAERI